MYLKAKVVCDGGVINQNFQSPFSQNSAMRRFWFLHGYEAKTLYFHAALSDFSLNFFNLGLCSGAL